MAFSNQEWSNLLLGLIVYRLIHSHFKFIKEPIFLRPDACWGFRFEDERLWLRFHRKII